LRPAGFTEGFGQPPDGGSSTRSAFRPLTLAPKIADSLSAKHRPQKPRQGQNRLRPSRQPPKTQPPKTPPPAALDPEPAAGKPTPALATAVPKVLKILIEYSNFPFQPYLPFFHRTDGWTLTTCQIPICFPLCSGHYLSVYPMSLLKEGHLLQVFVFIFYVNILLSIINVRN
jgi:hypothetical protein